jgi:hypothetical protein
VHGLGIKEAVFRGVVRDKYTIAMEKDEKKMQKRTHSIKLNKNFGVKVRTESGVEEIKNRSRFVEPVREVNRTLHTIDNHSFIRKHANKPS